MIKTAHELAAACIDVAKNHKTLYVMGCFGAPMNETNKKRYTQNNSYNKKAAQQKKINAASADTFGFDCVCLIKGLLWGWTGDTSKTYGGAKYKSNDVPDVNADTMITLCDNVRSSWHDILVGEVVWMKGHIGVYIGNGLVVECTPKWDNRVQVTYCKNLGKVAGYNGRKWTKHGKLPYVEYINSDPRKTVDQLAQEVLAGKWNNGKARREMLTASGYDYEAVQKRVNEILAEQKAAASLDKIAREVIAGKWGNGTERKRKLVAAGYNYEAVQKRVNELLKG